MINSLFAERLKEYMAEEGLNASALASKIHFSRSTVSQLLKGAHTPSTGIVISVSGYFNCSADYLLGAEEFPHITQFKPVRSFGGTLRKQLKECSKSVYRLQKELKISSSLTHRWLKHNAMPNVVNLIKLKNYFGCSLDYLLGRES